MDSKTNMCRWEGTDDKGTFTHQGTVVSLTANRVEFVNEHGSVFGVPLKGDGTITLTSTGGNKVGEMSVVATKSKADKPIINRPTSKKEKAIAIYKEMATNGDDVSRKNIIKKLVELLDMTERGASTYASMCRKIHTTV